VSYLFDDGLPATLIYYAKPAKNCSHPDTLNQRDFLFFSVRSLYDVELKSSLYTGPVR